jgi:hypothetical protein
LLVGGITQMDGGDLLAPKATDSLLAQTYRPGRQFAIGHVERRLLEPGEIGVLNYPLPGTLPRVA